MRTSEEKIERFDRRSSGHRKLSENRRTRLCGYKAYSNSKNGHDEHEEDNSYYQNSRKNYKSPGARYKQRRSRSSLSPSSSRHSCHEIRDDEKGHLIYHFGNFIDKRYQILSLLGEGTFGRCFKCFDFKRSEEIALKVIRNVERYRFYLFFNFRESAVLEIRALKTLQKKSCHHASLVINIIKSFHFGGHVCIVFPCLGKSVYDFLSFNDFQPFSFNQMKHISYQLISALKFLHSIKLTHTDLKPENMLFVNSDYEVLEPPDTHKKYKNILNTDIRLIDFGSATFSHEYHSRTVCTRHYRPPEVVLELEWSYSCDMWGAGCIMFELYKGKPMFLTHDNHEHLVMMEHILGPIPLNMIKESHVKKYFHHSRLIQDGKRIDHRYVEENCKRLKDTFSNNSSNHLQIYDLIHKLLTYEPRKRITSSDAANHPLFSNLHCAFGSN